MGDGDDTPAKRVVGNTDAVEPRIFSPYHTLGSLERAGDGRVSKD